MDQPRFGATSYNEGTGTAQLGGGPRTTRTRTDETMRPRFGADDYPDIHVNRRDTEANRRFRDFQERLRQEREQVLRKLREKDRAA
jgi:hypothetical protein